MASIDVMGQVSWIGCGDPAVAVPSTPPSLAPMRAVGGEDVVEQVVTAVTGIVGGR
jgi:hypothetical protein